jgi:hypothetical protein
VRKSAGAATQKGQKFLLIVDFMANLSDAFFAARSNSKRPPHFSAPLFAFVGDADQGGVLISREPLVSNGNSISVS